MFSKSLLAALAVAPAVVSAGSAIVKNQCAKTAYLWSVSVDSVGTLKTIAPGATYSEPYYSPSSGGVSIKIANDKFGPYDSVAITQFEYTLEGMIWYDISNINGNPFTLSGLTLTPSVSSCPAKVCPAGQILCKDAYNKPDDDQATGACASSADTTFVLCSGNTDTVAAPVAEAKVATPVEKKVATSTPAPAPVAPSSTPAAAAPAPTVKAVVEPEVINAGEWGVWTTFVTQIVTVEARDAAPEPTALAAKRDDSHVNMHKRAAHRHHFHRHGADVE